MATYYTTAVPSATAAFPQNVAGSSTSGGFAHARVRKTFGTYTNATPYVQTTDLLVVGFFKPSDRILDVRFYTDGAGTNGAIDIGVYSVNKIDGGWEFTVISNELFASDKATGTAIAYPFGAASVFTEDAVLADVDRGKPLWKLADLGDGTYTSDPGGVWAICADFTTIEDATSVYIFEVEYVAGD